MIEFWISDLKSTEEHFVVPCSVGSWEFHQRDDYTEVMDAFEKGQCVPSYYANNSALGRSASDEDFGKSIDELIDICLILSFVTGACVTPKGTTPQSEAQFVELGDSFIRPRAIRGFDSLKTDLTLSDVFKSGLPHLAKDFQQRRMRLFLSHWISGLTCFSIEDMFLSVGVQMDIVKQCEIQATGIKKTYFEGMESASTRYGISKLGTDYKNMRNDIVHEGRLSGSNFSGRTKGDCAAVTSDALNWIDEYVWSVLSKPCVLQAHRWKPRLIEYGLPALSLHV
jgi:hypothetical protein